MFFLNEETTVAETLEVVQEVQQDLEQLKPNVVLETLKSWIPGLTKLGYRLLVAALIVCIGFQIAKMLLAAPKVLIIESPFIGLDATTRKKLTELLADLARSGQVQIILSVSSPDDIPAFITHVYSLEKGVCGPKQTRDEFFAAEPFSTRRRKLAENYRNQPPRLPDGRTAPIPCEEMVRLRNITIRYGCLLYTSPSPRD